MSDGQYARAAEYEEEVLGLPTDAEVRVAAAWQFGVIQSALGRYREAIARLVAIADGPDAEVATSLLGGTHYQQGLALASELGMRPFVAHCHLGLGELYGRAGDRATATEHLTTAATNPGDARFCLGCGLRQCSRPCYHSVAVRRYLY